MNKKLFSFFVIFSLAFAAIAQEKMYICCNYNVRVRKSDDINSEAIGKIPPLAEVVIVTKTGTKGTVNGIDAYWVKVRYGELEGFVLDCFLQNNFSKAKILLAMEGIYQGYKVDKIKNLSDEEVLEIKNSKVTLEYLGYSTFALTYDSNVLDRGFNTNTDTFPVIIENLNRDDYICNRSADTPKGSVYSYFKFSGNDLVKYDEEKWNRPDDVGFELYLKKIALP